jgi:hypothetical protein
LFEAKYTKEIDILQDKETERKEKKTITTITPEQLKNSRVGIHLAKFFQTCDRVDLLYPLLLSYKESDKKQKENILSQIHS